MDLRVVKRELRKSLLEKRDALAVDERAAMSAAAGRLFLGLPEVAAAASLFLFVSFRSEIDTVPLIESLRAAGKRVIVPFTDIPNKRLVLYPIRGIADLRPGAYGILEPVPGSAPEAAPADIDAAVVPGSAFDLSGGRMGYGGGFYDRLLPQLRRGVPRIALAFDLQIVNSVPMGYYDQRMDIIVTERRVIRTSARG